MKMNQKIRISDVVKYVLLGAICSIFLIDIFFNVVIEELSFSSIDEWYQNYSEVVGSFSIVVILCLVSLLYSLGILVNYFVELLISFRRYIYNRFCKGKRSNIFAEVLVFVLGVFAYFSSMDSVFMWVKKRGKYLEHIPSWVYISDSPEQLLSIIKNKKYNDAKENIQSEYLYLNELFIGIRFMLTSWLIYMVFYCACDFTHIVVWIVVNFVQWMVFTVISSMLVVKYINEIDDFILANSIDISEQMNMLGMPCAYVLIRTTGGAKNNYITEAVNSVLNQDYPNIMMLVLEDTDGGLDTDAREGINKLIRAREKEDVVKLFYYADNCGSAAAAALSIRRKFLDLASGDDVAISLDCDDMFEGKSFVSNVVLRMKSTKADICLVNYSIFDNEKNNIISNDTYKFHRKLVSMLSSNGSALLGAKVKNLFAAASMGWTKCYNITALQKFIDIVDGADRIDGNKKFAEIPSYEDFVDVICFAIKGVKITGSEKSVVHYRQHGDSITSSITEISFKKYRTNFLHYLEYAEDAGKCLNVLDESAAREIVSSFVKFKLWVIMGIIDAKKDSLPKYSSTNFITDYISGGKFAGNSGNYGDGYSKDGLEKFYGDVFNYFKGL